ncbi:hypothetical protein HOV23_gp089 [Pseudomonas phage Lana]|uniref:Uncharacterized protein n=1 Tax=Pseudomonas phage Lana TaxID=2530172 RepID=A0A481W5W6_9CAUD|nr:hypothetical protein HOV23_gp089 [Pseudomonas phage Lana]QBJ04484.1 hypothetical protein [Pseudomonas phage Lana]
MANQYMSGDIVRYGDGSTALAKLHEPHAGGWHGDQCMGGTTYIGIERIQRLADEDDLRKWDKCAWWRGEGIPPCFRPQIRIEKGRWVVNVLPAVPHRWQDHFVGLFRQAVDYVAQRNAQEGR